MKLMVSSYNNGALDWNAEAEETAFIDYKITHRFNEPAECTITISDPTGAKARTYNVDANDVYEGPGKVTVEDPTGTDVFYGRILKAEGDTTSRTLTLYCQDWLSQLDEEQIIYDMREILGGGSLRESIICPDYDNSDGLGIRPAHVGGPSNWVYDHDVAFGFDTFNGMYLVFSNKMAGTITVKTCPYADTVTPSAAPMTVDAFTHDIGDLWTVDADTHSTADGDDFTVDYNFRVWVPDSGFYVSTVLSGAKIHVYYEGGSSVSTIELYNGAGYDIVASADTPGTDPVWQTITIPDNLVASSLDASGEVIVRFNESNATGGGFIIHYLAVEYSFVTTGYSAATAISDCENKRLTVATDFSTDATRVWHGVPYSIAKNIYLHIEAATGPVLGGDSMVTLTCAAANVENTSGVSTRRYIDQTRLAILQDLARQDKAEFWVALGGTTVTYKSTWNDAVADETLTDTDVNAWRATYDYETLTNKANVYGMRIGDEELYSTYSDAASIAKYKQTRTKVLRESGLVSEYDTLARATATVNQLKDVQMLITAQIRGNTLYATHANQIFLGDEIQITSTYLGLAAAWYIVQRFDYDSKSNMTTLLLHPRVSATGLQREEFTSVAGAMQSMRRGGPADKYIPEPI